MSAVASFGGLWVGYDDRVLSPREWTIAQSQWAAERSSSAPPGPILELCAGAGHIGLAAAQWCGRRLHQIDVDPVACAHACCNALRAGMADAVVVECRAIDELAGGGTEGGTERAIRYPIIIADPPYLNPSEASRYPDDPPLAVLGGPDGLDLVRSCLAVIDARLDDRGSAIVQLRGMRQVLAVCDHLARSTLQLEVSESRDYGPDRALALVRRR